MKIRFVSATRENEKNFSVNTALGRSLAVFALNQPEHFPFELMLFENNKTGLSTRYNEAIEKSVGDPAILAFTHDDVYLCDFDWAGQFVEALKPFDIVGVVGNKRRIPRQPSWAFVDHRLTWDDRQNLSGVVGCGPRGFPADCKLTVYGPARQEVKFLDGLILISHSETLLKNSLRFDEQFTFDFYDIDFC